MSKKRFRKEKIAISLDTKLLERIDEIKKTPQWADNRSNLIEEAIHFFLNKNQLNPCDCLFCKRKGELVVGAKNNFWMFVDRVNHVGICYQCLKNKFNEKDK